MNSFMGGFMSDQKDISETGPSEVAQAFVGVADRKRAVDRVKGAVVAGSISAGLTTLLSLIGIFYTPEDARLAQLFSPWSLLDAGLLWWMVWYVRKQSFAASVWLVVYWLFTIVMVIISAAAVGGMIMKLLFLYYFVNGALGAWWLRQNPEEDGGEAVAGDGIEPALAD